MNQQGVPMKSQGWAPRSNPIFSSGNPPIALDGRARISLDRQTTMLYGSGTEHYPRNTNSANETFVQTAKYRRVFYGFGC